MVLDPAIRPSVRNAMGKYFSSMWPMRRHPKMHDAVGRLIILKESLQSDRTELSDDDDFTRHTI